MNQSRVEAYKNRVLDFAKDGFVVTDDGYYYWSPSRNGLMSSTSLMIIAKELDRLNEGWDRQVREDLAKDGWGGDYDQYGH